MTRSFHENYFHNNNPKTGRLNRRAAEFAEKIKELAQYAHSPNKLKGFLY